MASLEDGAFLLSAIPIVLSIGIVSFAQKNISTTMVEAPKIEELFIELGIETTNTGVSTGSKWMEGKGELIESYSPVDGNLIGSVRAANEEEYNHVLNTAKEGFKEWRSWPAPKRGATISMPWAATW